MTLQPFSLERALAGDPVVTRDGLKVTAFIEVASRSYPVMGIIADDDLLEGFTTKGRFIDDLTESLFDLFMAAPSTQKSGWINVYAGPCTKSSLVHPTKEVALQAFDGSIDPPIATTEIHWNEPT